jgi:thiol:disulfide interchange protein DsbD
VSAGLWLLPGPRAEAIEWQGYDAALIEQAAKEQRPVLIKFMADWCLTCKAVEKTVYTKQSIAELIKRKAVLPIKADTTLKNHPATLALKSKYNEPAVPVSILLIPGREEPVKLHGLVIGAKLEELLKGLPDKELNINGSKEEKNKG